MGADKIINYQESQWWEVLKNEDYDVIYECVFSESNYENASHVLKKKGATFVSISSKKEKVTVGSLIVQGKKKTFLFYLIFLFFIF